MDILVILKISLCQTFSKNKGYSYSLLALSKNDFLGLVTLINYYIRESSTPRDSVHSETKALCPIRNFIIIFILATL